MKKYFIILILLIVVSSCTNQSSTERILQAQGYTDIKMTGYSFFACSKDDFYHTGFIAKSPSGRTVEGTVCEGLFFKGSTIRFK